MSASDEMTVHVLWAVSERYPLAQFVAAFSDGLHDAMREEFEARVTEAKEWFLSFDDADDAPWTFWTAAHRIEHAPRRPMPRREREAAA